MKFQHWLTLTIAHEYFENAKCPVFNFKPLASTQKVLKSYNIHTRKLENQYLAYVGLDSNKAMWEELPTGSDLFFQLLNTDPYFDSYTEVPLATTKNTMLLLTNAAPSQPTPEQDTTLSTIHLPVQPLRFRIETPASSTDSVVIKNRKGEELLNKVAAKGQSSLAVNLESFGTGVYELWINEKLKSTFFSTSESLEEDCYGIVQLKINPIVESLMKQNIPELTMHFAARKAYWQYAIVVPANKKITVHDMQIEGKGNTLYAGPEKKSIGTEKASVFTSPNAMKLSQNIRGSPLLKMKYSNEFSDSTLELDIKMPIPKASAILPRKTENTFYAQTIIYV